MGKLMIIESPGKLGQLRSLLGPGWNVQASMGHVRDLPEKSIGAEPPDFIPRFEVTDRGRRMLGDLAKAVWEAEEVYLATDPDREGEALAWHLKECLSLGERYQRVSFNEITAKAVREAIAHPRRIDMDLVRSQEARRVIDKLVGYVLSPAVSRLRGEALSVGRVQTPAVRLVCARAAERHRGEMNPAHHLVLEFGEWIGVWEASDEECRDRALIEKAATVKEAVVASCEARIISEPPPPPLNTAGLLQASFRKIGLSCMDTMRIAQRLYERGAITYHRTDNPNISAESLADIALALDGYGMKCVALPRTFPLPPGAQAGHPAITPTRWEVTTEGLGEKAEQVYKLIRARGLLSQAEDATCRVRVVRLTADACGLILPIVAVRRAWVQKGWRSVLRGDAALDKDPAFGNPVPKLAPGERVKVTGVRVTRRRLPSHYDEASLVARLEHEGVGRPSTYAAIIHRIIERGLVARCEVDGKAYLVPTKAGASILRALVGRSRFVELDYTRGMELRLDAIASGKASYSDVVREANELLMTERKAIMSSAAARKAA
jgi:DNA topoisomerase-1